MRQKTAAAILDSAFKQFKITAAVSFAIEWTVAKKTAELTLVINLMAGKIFTFPVLKKSIAHLPYRTYALITILVENIKLLAEILKFAEYGRIEFRQLFRKLLVLFFINCLIRKQAVKAVVQ